MKRVWISILASLGIAGVTLAGGMALWHGAGDNLPPAPEIADLRQELSSIREEFQDLVEEIRNLQATQQALVKILSAPAGAESRASGNGEGDVVPVVAAIPEPGKLTEYVAAVITEERKLQEAERQRSREEGRKRAEEKRQELEAMRQGPYDRYNSKVNSLAKVLGMTEAQKQAYFELASGYRNKLDETMKQQRASRIAQSPEPSAQSGESGEGQRRGRRPEGGDRNASRELYDTLQKSFSADLQTILSQDQLKTYGNLSRSAQSFQNLDVVSASGERSSGFESNRGFFGGGRTPGGSGGGRPGR